MILKASAAAEDGDSGTFQGAWRTVCTAGLNSDKEMGSFCFGDFWLIDFRGVREVSQGRTGL